MKSYKWFRFYNDALHDPKVQTMPPAMFKAWVNILCLASKSDGKIRNDATMQWGLRKSIDETKAILDYLDGRGLLEFRDDCFVPHNWDKWQYKSDVSNERVKRYRERHRNVTVTPPEQIQSRTDTERKVVPLRGPTKGKSRKIEIPDNWKPSNDSLNKAEGLGLTPQEIARETQRFRNHAKEKARQCVRWDSAFDNWCLKAAEFLNRSPPVSAKSGFSALPGSAEFQAWRTFFRDGGKAALVRILDQREMEGRPFEFEMQWPPQSRVQSG